MTFGGAIHAVASSIAYKDRALRPFTMLESVRIMIGMTIRLTVLCIACKYAPTRWFIILESVLAVQFDGLELTNLQTADNVLDEV
jgi:hypothetical protein